MKSRLNRALFSIVIFIIISAVFILATERPFLRFIAPDNKTKRAAVAIRDNVIPFQKFGTRLFTTTYLQQGYDTVFYFTASDKNNQSEALINAVKFATSNYAATDIFLLAHANYYHNDIASLGYDYTSRIRLVYNTGCNGANLCSFWKKAGIKAYVSHTGNSLSPVFYLFFLRRWCNGYSLKEAVRESNFLTAQKLLNCSFFFTDSSTYSIIKNGTFSIINGNDRLNISAKINE